MQSRWHKRFVVGTLILAALAVHVDLPRMHLRTSIGDTLNAIRVSDPVSHILLSRLVDELPEQADLAEQLEEGRQSLELLAHTPAIEAVLPPTVVPTLDTVTEPVRFDNGAVELFELNGLGGSLLNIDLPPPRAQSLYQPPRFELPFAANLASGARAPPLALR